MAGFPQESVRWRPFLTNLFDDGLSSQICSMAASPRKSVRWRPFLRNLFDGCLSSPWLVGWLRDLCLKVIVNVIVRVIVKLVACRLTSSERSLFSSLTVSAYVVMCGVIVLFVSLSFYARPQYL